MVIQLGGLRVHNMLRRLHSIHPMQFRSRLIRLFVRMFVHKQIFDLTRPRSSLVDSKGGSEFAVSTDLNSVKH